MRASLAEVGQALRDGGGVIARRHRPELAGTLDWLLRTKQLVAVLPGIYARDSRAGELEVRVRAAALWEPNLVFTGATAARLSFWPGLEVKAVTGAVPAKRRPPAGFVVSRRSVPSELLLERRGIRITAPALTALDLCDTHGGDALDTVLRSRQTTMAHLHQALALTSGRAGNTERRALLLESRGEPWSAAERQGHRLLHAARITGWKANFPFEVRALLFFLDIAFPRRRLAVEIDGRKYHTDKLVFEQDRWRQNEIVLAGWRILRFTWDMVCNQPRLVLEHLRRALALCP